MAVVATLHMYFETELGTTADVQIRPVQKTKFTADNGQALRAVMSAIVGEDVFSFGATKVLGAKITEYETTEIFTA